MPQEFHVIRCFACLVFQVHQVGKKPKWQCKMCGEKQSVRKVYGRGSGKECRLLVQSLNMTAGQMADEDTTNCQPTFSGHPGEEIEILQTNENTPDIDECPKSSSSKWNRFCEEEPDESNISEEDGCQGLAIPSELVTTERPSQFKRKKSRNSFNTGHLSKRIRQDRNTDRETLPEANHQENGPYPGCSSHETVKMPSWDRHFSLNNVRQRNQDIYPPNIRPTNLINPERDSITQQHGETFIPDQVTTKSSETARGPLCMQQNAGANVSLNISKKDNKQHCEDMTITSASHYESAKVNEKQKTKKSSAASVSSNSKWAVFAEPDSDNDDGDDFGEEATLDVDICFERKSCEDVNGDAFEEFSTQEHVSEPNLSISNRRLSGIGTNHLGDLHENQPLESRNLRLSTMNDNIHKYPDSHQNKKMEEKGWFGPPVGHPIARRPQSHMFNNIQNSIKSSSESRKPLVPQVRQTNTDSALHLSAREAGISHNVDQRHMLSRQSFQLADEDLEDLPDDFDVW
ncbi:uncharacterized protein LOC105437909 [Strongylocentrotus purpuratus]|uniref:MRN complex-interacting protein N-terminal domain-containing protein n=1 Tax=Strongylocentrotus purpuratus TaxID=7668 RepID=A0A7M7HFY9_STRPU|nr:uncharacterized protein LOC105437909 [Strongylocentrotus purpuratus]|eukprot:XP_011663358.1 PREDICTED: uncharacterized protein LOC105437909 [Strongylocentrotus purpuratus]